MNAGEEYIADNEVEFLAQWKELKLVGVDVFVYGNGVVEFEGEKYRNNETIQITEGEDMELSFVPEPKAELRSVTVGSNGIATPYGAREEITLDSVSGYTTVTAMFGSAPEYSITYVLNGGENSPENPEKYTKGTSFTFSQY